MSNKRPLWLRRPETEDDWVRLTTSLLMSLDRKAEHRLTFMRIGAPEVLLHDLARRTWRVYWRLERVKRRLAEHCPEIAWTETACVDIAGQIARARRSQTRAINRSEEKA